MTAYTCADYRAEMILAGLVRQLQDKDLSEAKRIEITKEIKKLKEKMGLD